MKHASALALVLVAISPCFAAKDKGGIGPQIDVQTISSQGILSVLDHAASLRVNPAGISLTLSDSDKSAITACNGGKIKFGTEGESACWEIFHHHQDQVLSNQLNVTDDAFLASVLARGCGVWALSDDYHMTRGGETCGTLGFFLARVGNWEAAEAVWSTARGCYSLHRIAGTPVNGCIGFALTNRDHFTNAPEVLAAMARRSCSSIHDRASCEYLASLGETVDMAAVAEAEEAQHDSVAENRDRNSSALEQARADADSRRNAILGALQGMQGESDPNAIGNAGNQQASTIRAAGTTRSNQQSVSSPAAEKCPNMQGYPDAGASCNPVRSESTCVKIVSATWNPATATGAGMLRVTFENICGSTVRITAWGPAGGSNSGETQNVSPGAQYVFDNDRQQYQYQADDGIDCSGNIMRPGCKYNSQ